MVQPVNPVSVTFSVEGRAPMSVIVVASYFGSLSNTGPFFSFAIFVTQPFKVNFVRVPSLLMSCVFCFLFSTQTTRWHSLFSSIIWPLMQMKTHLLIQPLAYIHKHTHTHARAPKHTLRPSRRHILALSASRH